MRRSVVPGLVGLFAAAIVALLVYGVTQQGADNSLDKAIASGKPPAAHDAALPLLGGDGKRTLADYRGKVVMLNFFASWCQPCAQEAPALARTQKLMEQGGGTILGVVWDDSSENASAFLREHGLSYPALRDVDGSYARAYGVKGMPESFVIDRTGHVVALSRGVIDDQFVKQHIAPLLTPKPQ